MKPYRRKMTFSEMAEIELSYKSAIKWSEAKQITTSRDAYQLLRDCWDGGKLELVEQCIVLLLNRAHKSLGFFKASTGGVYGTVVDPKIIMAAAIKANATALFLCHNHPSGNLTPSQADKSITQKIKEGAAFFDMKLLDHLIITEEGYYSFADQGIL